MEEIAGNELTLEKREQTMLELADFDEVVRLYRPRILRFLLSSLTDRDAAETLTQECFLKAWNARHQFRGDASLGTWLTRIAVNLMRDHLRSRIRNVAARCQARRGFFASAVNLPRETPSIPVHGRDCR